MQEFSDIVAERAALSILVNNPVKTLEINDILSGSDFSLVANQIIYDSLADLIDEDLDNIDKIAIRNKALELGFNNFDLITDEGKYLDALFVQKVNVKNLEKCVKRIKDLSIKRKLSSDLEEMQNTLSQSEDDKLSSTDLIASFEQKINETVNVLDNRNKIGLLGEGFWELINDRADNPTDMVGISTGYQRFDLAIGGGLRRESVTLIGARPKNFKSGFALNIAKNLAVECVHNSKPIPVLILDTELQPEYQRFRLGASASKTPINILETGAWRSNKHIVESAKIAADRIKSAPIYHIYIGGFPLEKTLITIKYWLTKFVGRDENGKFKDCLIVYDYIKLMDSKDIKKDLAEWQVLGFHMTALHDLITRFSVPMLVMCQLNRDGSENDDDTVFAGADRLIWFASNICILRQKKREELEEDGPTAGNFRIKVLLTRYGQGMDQGDYLNLRINKACMLAEEGKLKSELPRGQEIGKEEADKIEDEVEGPYD